MNAAGRRARQKPDREGGLGGGLDVNSRRSRFEMDSSGGLRRDCGRENRSVVHPPVLARSNGASLNGALWCL